jgi:hypothetical protein
VKERVQVVDETLVQTIELMAFVGRESAVGRDRAKESGGQRCVDALEEFQKEEADSVSGRK